MKVRIKKAAMKYLGRLPEPLKSAIADAINGLESEPPEGDIRPVAGRKGLWRLKEGDFRVLYKIQDGLIFVTHIVPRGQAYAKKARGKK